jgi:hypothetical protein
MVLFALILVCQPAIGQTEKTEEGKESKSGLVIESGKYKPFLEVAYGSSTPRYEGLGEDFATLGMLELKVGYVSDDILKNDLISFDQHYAFVSWLNSDLSASGDAGEGEIGSEMNRFGFGNRWGYGYGGSGLKFELYNQEALDWTKLTPVEYDSMSEDAQAVFDRYGSTYRFGQLTEAGLRVHLSESIALTGGLEGAMIMPRTVFWPWLGSVAIYSLAQGGLEHFSDNIIEASPKAGPVIAWLLKSGVAAGYYYLLREDMNWPFGYEAPVTVGSYKIGATITF